MDATHDVNRRQPSPQDQDDDDKSGVAPRPHLTLSDPMDRKEIRNHVLKGFFRLLSVGEIVPLFLTFQS